MKLFVTGGAGFIGSNFVHRAVGLGHTVLNLDCLSYAGNLRNLDGMGEPGHRFVRGSILDRGLLRSLLRESAVDAILNFAAESHVDRSIADAYPFVDTNVGGTTVLLEEARRAGVPIFIQISTDEVYGSLPLGEGKFTLDSPIKPSSPYAASKAAADHVALAFHHTYGMDVRVTRCTNNFGRFQYPEKFIPTIVFAALDRKPIPIYGDGKYVRDWIYVEDHCNGILRVLERGSAGAIYHFGGATEIDNLTLTSMVLGLVSEITETRIEELAALVTHVADRPGHDRRYALDWSATERELGWTPATGFPSALKQSIQWYIEHRDWWEVAG